MKQHKSKQMPVSPVYQYGNPTGKPESTSNIKYGNDLRAGQGKSGSRSSRSKGY